MKAGLGNRLVLARAAAGLSAKKLSLKSGVSVRKIRLIEKGGTMFSLDDICKLRKALGVTLGYLIDGEGLFDD